jgi:hypothetical protein
MNLPDVKTAAGEQAGGDDVLLAPPERARRTRALDAGALGSRHSVLRLLG